MLCRPILLQLTLLFPYNMNSTTSPSMTSLFTSITETTVFVIQRENMNFYNNKYALLNVEHTNNMLNNQSNNYWIHYALLPTTTNMQWVR